ncbi:MAG: MFS transporter [Dysgonamonadaceae bacterium]|jgi:nucleoside transporter|nr:MFS transporter [Dysgonamonadaceae bacterium]
MGQIQQLKFKLIVMNFLQFFVWGLWMMTLWSYGNIEKSWNSAEFGWVFSTMGFASLLMPTLFGIWADKWKPKNVFAILHLCFGLAMCFLPFIDRAMPFFWVLLVAMCFYMPTIGLNNSINFAVLKKDGKNPIKAFPPIRVWGTIGFIVAMWVANVLVKDWAMGLSIKYTFVVSAVFAFVLAIFAFVALPNVSTNDDAGGSSGKKTLVQLLGLDAFALFKQRKMAVFFIFSLLLGAALQLTNAYGDGFLADVNVFPQEGLINNLSTIILSISQMSETLFILAIPFFMQRFGIKKVMLFSMLAWVLRFGLFGLADNSALGFGLIVVSCIVYGLAFDFFNISGALFTEQNSDGNTKNSAQGLFMLMTNGIGAVLGNVVAGYVITTWFTETGAGVMRNGKATDLIHWNIEWFPNVWFVFAAYALVVGVLFALIFKYKHNPMDVTKDER